MDHVTVEIDVSPPVQPMSMVVGRTLPFDPGRHDSTCGSEPPALDLEVVAADVTTWGGGVAGGELAANPMAKPIPSAARTAAAAPSRTTVLRWNVITWVDPPRGCDAPRSGRRHRVVRGLGALQRIR